MVCRLSTLATVIALEECRFALEGCFFRNGPRAKYFKERLDFLYRSPHADLISKLSTLNHDIVAYEIKSLIAMVLRKEAEKRRNATTKSAKKPIKRGLSEEQLDDIENYINVDPEEAETDSYADSEHDYESDDYFDFGNEAEEFEEINESEEFERIEEPDSEDDFRESWQLDSIEESEPTPDKTPTGVQESVEETILAEIEEPDDGALPEMEVHTIKDFIRLLDLMRP